MCAILLFIIGRKKIGCVGVQQGQLKSDRLTICKVHIEMERNMTETGLWIFLICLLLVVLIATVVAVVSAVSGAAAAIVDDEESEEE